MTKPGQRYQNFIKSSLNIYGIRLSYTLRIISLDIFCVWIKKVNSFRGWLYLHLDIEGCDT